VHIPWSGWSETDLRTAANQPPIADAAANQTVNTATVNLASSNSNDPGGGHPLAYLWTQTGGPAVALSDPALVRSSAPNRPSARADFSGLLSRQPAFTPLISLGHDSGASCLEHAGIFWPRVGVVVFACFAGTASQAQSRHS
jgi:hypothetical protein